MLRPRLACVIMLIMSISPPDAGELPADSPPDAPKGKVRLLSLADLDGRTAAARVARKLIGELENDLGGSDRLSAAERTLVHRAALVTAGAENLEAGWLVGRGLDVAACTALVNIQRRLLVTVGLQRRPRGVTPALSD
jgi:hypothetical protein